MLNNKLGLALLLALVFATNLLETSFDASLHVSGRHASAPVSASGYKAAYALQQLEPKFVNFEFHDTTTRWAMYAYSISYFLLLPCIGALVIVALLRRREIAPFRVFCLAVAIDYAASLPWFLFFPVPERWAYPESGAILLSDLWSARLIEYLRPVSALNNTFPSTHVSLTIVVVLVCWLFRVRFRQTVTALGLTIVLATFTLGIHWLADILAGFAVGGLSVAVAMRFTDVTERWELAHASS